MKIGIDLGGTNIRIGKVQGEEIIQKISAPSPAKMSLEKSLSYLKSVIHPILTPEVEGIGIGVPSVVDVERGMVYNVTNIPAWVEVPLKEVLEEEFRLPVHINNDSNCFVMGEKKYGAAKPYSNVIGLTLGTGVGAGIILNNQLYNGSNTGAGEVGCIPYLGKVYEHFCGSEFFSSYHNTTGRFAADLARKGEEKALRIWEEYGAHVGELIKVVMYAYDPDAIILGGGIANAYEYFEKTMWETFAGFFFPKSLKQVKIMASTTPDIAIFGAAALVKEESNVSNQKI